MNPVAIIAKLTGLDARAARLVGWAALAAVLMAAGAYHAVTTTWSVAERVAAAHTAGVAAGEASERALWQAAAARERDRQATANAEAIAAADRSAAALRRERDDLAQALEDMTNAADTDPDRDRECLDAAGVRRLDALR